MVNHDLKKEETPTQLKESLVLPPDCSYLRSVKAGK
jgi:hypothetical protein